MQPDEKGTQKDLIFYRIETAQSDIKAAEILLNAKEFRGANNRAYYGIYHVFYIATREEAEEQIETGKQLLELIEEYIKRKLKDNNK